MSVATLVGIDLALGDGSAGLQLCLPVVSLEGDGGFYVARRIEWAANGFDTASGLTAVDDDELEEFATMLPSDQRRVIEPERGVLVVGDDFANDLKAAGVCLSGVDSTVALQNEGYSITVMTIESFRHLQAELYRAVSVVFDEALGSSGSYGLSIRGRAASRVLQQSTNRQTDLAVRELAAAVATCDFDILRRLLVRYSIALKESEDQLEAKARRHIRWCRSVQTNAPAYDSVRAMEWTGDGPPMCLAAKRIPRSVVEYRIDLAANIVGPMRETTSVPAAKYEIDRPRRSMARSGKTYDIGSRREPWITNIGNSIGQRRGYRYMKNEAKFVPSDYLVGAV